MGIKGKDSVCVIWASEYLCRQVEFVFICPDGQVGVNCKLYTGVCGFLVR